MTGRSKPFFWTFLAGLLVVGGVLAVLNRLATEPDVPAQVASKPRPPVAAPASPAHVQPASIAGIPALAPPLEEEEPDEATPGVEALLLSSEEVLGRFLEGKLDMDAANLRLADLRDEKLAKALVRLEGAEAQAFRERCAPAGFFMMGPEGQWAVVRDGHGYLVQIGVPGRAPSEGGIPAGVPMDTVITTP